jgi:uncharacterized protein (TIGR03066 family)
MARKRRTLVFCFVLIASCVPTASRAGEIVGLVRDYVTSDPLDGVRVSVEGDPSRKPVPTVNGRYKIDGLTAGKYKLSFDLTGYSPRPDDHSCTLDKAGDKKQIDTELMKDDPALVKYYAQAGKKFVALVKQDGGTKNDYASRWHEIRRFAPHPSSKVLIVKSISEADARAREFLPLAQYVDVPQKRVDELLRGFAPNETTLKVPAKSLAEGLGDELVADIAIYAVHKSSAERKAKALFIDSIASEWKEMGSAKIVVSWTKRAPYGMEDDSRMADLDPKKLIGKWQMKEREAPEPTLEFTKDGKLTITAEADGQKIKFEGTYKLDGKKLITTVKIEDKEVSETRTIHKLTDDQIVYEGKDGKKETLTRIKPK